MDMTGIGKKELKHLAELSRIELHEHEEEKIGKDLEKILKHFEELKEIPTEGVPPLTGGTLLKNIARADGEGSALSGVPAVEAFPEAEKGFLKVPPVFE
jgi:aspartyl-tRNA(Asn)/glutamyl-tRNA(Gln) amidotransferase subunit C